MNPRILGLVGVAAVIGIGAVVYVTRDAAVEESPTVELPDPQDPPFIDAGGGEPQIRHPVPETPEDTAVQETAPLPALNESDMAIQDSLANLVGRKPLTQFLVPKDVIRRTVATIDNLTRTKMPVRMRPVMPTEGTFAAAGNEEENSVTLDEANFARYTPFVQAVQATDAGQLTELYFRFYPLFQQAYEDLGYPGGYFNDRLVEVIDHLLEAPDVQGPIRLTRPHVMYEFADSRLEQLSSGQKLLIRMGSENATALKAKLREVRREISGQTPPR